MNRRGNLREQLFETLAPLLLGRSAQVGATFRQQVESDEAGRRFFRQRRDARRGRVQTELQKVEIESC